jgi:hypothetical protein
VAKHKDTSIVNSHFSHRWEYANEAARTGATGFVSAEVGLLARQLDDNSFWVLTAITPTWVVLGGGGGGDVTAASVLADNAIVRGDGGGKGIQDSGILVDDSDNMSGVGELGVDRLQYDISHTPPTEPEGQIWWNTTDKTLNIATGLGPVLQPGQETYVLVYNGTGSQIDNGTPVYPVGAVAGRPSVAKANAETHVKILGVVIVTTMDIPNGTVGIATDFGKVRGVDTDSFNVGDTLWVDTTDGAMTNVKPEFPAYAIQLGGVTVKDPSDGEIIVDVKGQPDDTVINFWNGIFRETIDFTVSSNGTVVTGSLSPENGHDDMTMMFSDGFTMLTTTPPATIVLIAGTDTNPQANYVYIPISTKVLTVSTSDWPTTEHIKVAEIGLRSASATQIEGAFRNQNWNDHIEDTTSFQGHMSHIVEAIRNKIAATWWSGAEGTMTINTGPTPDDVFVSVTGGEVYQLHRQAYPAQDMSTGDPIFVVNHNTTPYSKVTNLNTQLLDANGNSLNDSSFSFVVWGVQNRAGETSHLMVNLPSGSYAYTFPERAVSDANNFSVYDIPRDFQGVGFLIARFTCTYKNDVWTLEDTQDLRGYIPNTTAGGGASGGGVTTLLGLTDTPSTYSGHSLKALRVNAGETAVEFASGVTPSAHATSHQDSGSDEINVTDLSGLLADGQTPLAHKATHENGGTDEMTVVGLSGLLADGQTPLAHKTSHQSGGADDIKLDDLATPDDNTDLNTSISAHGLAPKLSNVVTQFFNGQGGWTEPTGDGHVDVLIVEDRKSSGTHGGASSAGAYNDRTLNTVVLNTISGASLSSNQITLPSGKYLVWARCPGVAVDNHYCEIANTSNTPQINGANAMTGYFVETTCSDAPLAGSLNINSSTAYKLRHYTQRAVTSFGLGNAVNKSGRGEVYSQVVVIRIGDYTA